MYCIILLYYYIICVVIILFAGCSVIVGRHDSLPCAAPFKSLQGVAVPFSFFSFIWHCKLLIITPFNKYILEPKILAIRNFSHPAM